jgi:cobalt/nickel transport system permease protein
MSGAHFRSSYAHLDSPVHRAPACVKVLATLLLVSAIALVPVDDVGAVVAVLAALVGLSRLARVPLGVFAARVAMAEPFVLGVAVLSLFQGRGLAVFAAVALKSTTCVVAVQLLAHTTPFQEVLAVIRRAKVPAVLVATLALLYRYLYVVVEETQRMRRARAARTWSPRQRGSWSGLSSVIALSLVRSMARAERVHVAMRARGGP